MTCAEAVRLHLLSLTPVTTLVNQRVFTLRFPQSPNTPTLPAVLVTQISDVQQSTLRGTSGLTMCRIQVDVIAKTIGAARSVDQAIQGDYVNGAATGLRGATAGVGSPASTIHNAVSDNYREEFDGEELNQARVMRDYRVWFEGD